MDTVGGMLAEALRIERLCGENFDRAWVKATSVALRVAAPSEREAWADALEDTRETWRASYDRQPAMPGVEALAALEGGGL